jgi:prepilin-type N-terminal cleavage/methylation domain-containing protein
MKAFSKKTRGFTLLEMMITLAIFVLLAAAVFGMLTGVLQSTSSLQDNQNRSDQLSALNALLKNKLCAMPAAGTIASYQRGSGEGLTQNGVIFGTATMATAIDAKVQDNGYYTLRLTTYATTTSPETPQDARTILQQLVTSDDPTVVWSNLITDVKTLDWKFLDFNVTQWVELWPGPTKPNLIEFSMQTAGDLQPTTMDYWIPQLQAAPNFATALSGGGGGRGGGGGSAGGGRGAGGGGAGGGGAGGGAGGFGGGGGPSGGGAGFGGGSPPAGGGGYGPPPGGGGGRRGNP